MKRIAIALVALALVTTGVAFAGNATPTKDCTCSGASSSEPMVLSPHDLTP